jgi:hypothetical protein
MKIRYKFKLKGVLEFPSAMAFQYKGRHYDFHQEGKFVAGISVTVGLQDSKDWPTIFETRDSVAEAHIDIRCPGLEFIAMEMRNLEGFLSLFGVMSIGVSTPEIEWLPDSAEERDALKIFRFKRDLAEPEPSKHVPLPPDLMARCIVASYDAFDAQIPMAFYRRDAKIFLSIVSWSRAMTSYF